MAELVALPVSPWSEKARWALDHHRVPYTYREYVPMLFEPWLRARLKKPFGLVSVPVLFAEGKVVRDSFAIARYADSVGSGASLFPASRMSDIVAWNERSEAALSAGRVVALRRMRETPGAGGEALPRFVPDTLRPVLGGGTSVVLGFLQRKYAAGASEAGVVETIGAALEGLRGALNGRAYLLEELSYADIAMAMVVQVVRPVRDGSVPLGPALREAWSIGELGERFGDLVAWRDALYAKHRRSWSA
jgi:glutathione S-transferase